LANLKPKLNEEEEKELEKLKKKVFEINKKRLQKDWREKYMKKEDKFSKLRLKPKYFFSNLNYDKVIKLRRIFLEFDGDGSRKLELNEMEEMFQDNKIKVTMDELQKRLFFVGQTIKDGQIPYLDFYHFMEFGLSKEADQLYRNFMREVKQKLILKQEKRKKKKRKKEEKRARISCTKIREL